jgi:hypothetical protein
MSRLDELRSANAEGTVERDVLARARAALSPSAADAERVRRALTAALSAAPAMSAGSAPASAPKVGRLGRAGSHLGSWGGRLIAGATIAAVAGSAGYMVGLRNGRRAEATHAAPVSATATGVGDRAPLTERPVDSTPTVARLADADARPAAALAPARKHATPVPKTPSPAPPSLEDEVRGVRAVERALREGSPSLALALLTELDRTVPDGRLVEERAATGAIARCALGRVPFGVDLAAEFGDRYPESAYLKRVRQSCAKAPVE